MLAAGDGTFAMKVRSIHGFPQCNWWTGEGDTWCPEPLVEWRGWRMKHTQLYKPPHHVSFLVEFCITDPEEGLSSRPKRRTYE